MIEFQTVQDGLAFDARHIWHPYTSLRNPLPTYPVVSATGTKLTLADGTELVDGMASWWSAIHGYNHPRLNQALVDQASQMSHVMFGGITHPPAVQLARQLLAMAPEGLDAVFFADSGSVAVEVAIKMALQYQTSRGKPEKSRLLTIRQGYHGDTFAAMAVCDPVNGMHGLFQSVLPHHLFAPAPQLKPEDTWQDVELDAFESLLAAHHQELAAIILEPIVQGAGGMRFYHPGFLAGARRLADAYDVLLIADEIATGFGRTGRLFACEHANISPDILCVGKALTGGYMTLAATLASRHVADTIGQGEASVLMHGPTFMANPLACAVACESLAMVAEGHWQQDVPRIEAQLKRELAPCRAYEQVADVRVFGAIGVVEMKTPIDVAKAQAFLVKQGVWIRPFGTLLYIMPPYIATEQDIQQLTQAIAAFCQHFA
ncbi:adenosylmethionine--8-amino-7-oxononanoate transaminase [Aliidiomarina taiwanensis]|uniref:Adenosylmethionine-8-amino-7-oxononanoate aminotransferase n=1 Tax=Aliidiomarina taiwanensis TaxID=946228 RepID=A0A432X9U8_9GAMM|nr:adenosylmethionine--8-amino-7-oxononanoate transaminase [Aliidiomarina taiwanensis]RUO44192.1 adenosylmethionine--8-amino-7-oxononanoate transaminase [Aliidiomarina taiwanensis]